MSQVFICFNSYFLSNCLKEHRTVMLPLAVCTQPIRCVGHDSHTVICLQYQADTCGCLPRAQNLSAGISGLSECFKEAIGGAILSAFQRAIWQGLAVPDRL